MLHKPLPSELKKYLDQAELIRPSHGHSGSNVFYIKDGKGEKVYLKIAPSQWNSSLIREYRCLEWLRGRLPVPEVLYFQQYQGYDYLLITEIVGLDASHETFRAKPEKLVRLLAEGLQWIHSIDLSSCPLDRRLEVKLQILHHVG